MKPEITPEQAKAILANAPKGATHVDVDHDAIINHDWLKYNSVDDDWYRFLAGSFRHCGSVGLDEFYSIHALSDLRQIVEQAEMIETLKSQLTAAEETNAEFHVMIIELNSEE